MGAIATFDYEKWLARYPEFNGSVTKAQAEAYFVEATIYHANDGSGLVAVAEQQRVLLDMLVAHIAKLYATVNGQTPSGVPGRISNASEGSVSVGYDLANMPAAAAWFAQTSYGLSYWQATAAYRTARYLPGSRPVFGAPYGGGYPRRWGGAW